MVFTAESQFWCFSDTALGLMLQRNSLLAAPHSFFRKAKFALVIEEADTAGTEALVARQAKHLTFSSHCPSWAPLTVPKNSLKAFSTSSLWTIASRLYIWLGIFCIFFGLGFFSLPLSYSGFTKVFVSGITDVTQSSREMTYFGSGLDLASQGNVYCYDFTL